jgi:flagellar biosynthesis anti-sigma factor FlgM
MVMKIEGSRPPENQEITLRTQKLGKQEAVSGPSESPQPGNMSDQVHLSGRANELEQLKEVINQMPDIRMDKVEALKKSIQEGSYKVDSFQVAGKILEEI